MRVVIIWVIPFFPSPGSRGDTDSRAQHEKQEVVLSITTDLHLYDPGRAFNTIFKM